MYGEELDFDREQSIELSLQIIRVSSWQISRTNNDFFLSLNDLLFFQNTLSDYLLRVREREESDLLLPNPLFGMDDLFSILKSADTLEHAMTIQDIIKEIWKECKDQELRSKLDTGIAYLVEGNTDQALCVFTKIVETDTHYGEAWNKKSTAHYMAGHVQESLEAARKALEIEPRNFQALAGIGLVEMDSSSSVEKAIQAFRKCISLNPWSMVSARLTACLRKQEKAAEDSDAGQGGDDSFM